MINGTEFNVGKNGNDFCDGGDKWKREGTINLKDAKMCIRDSYWTPDGSATLPAPRWGTTIDQAASGTRYWYDGSYLRLKNVELSYTCLLYTSQSVLVDALWDKQIGREKIEELAKYGKDKGCLLYTSITRNILNN